MSLRICMETLRFGLKASVSVFRLSRFKPNFVTIFLITTDESDRRYSILFLIASILSGLRKVERLTYNSQTASRRSMTFSFPIKVKHVRIVYEMYHSWDRKCKKYNNDRSWYSASALTKRPCKVWLIETERERARWFFFISVNST